jgi:hypothetical protein
MRISSAKSDVVWVGSKRILLVRRLDRFKAESGSARA